MSKIKNYLVFTSSLYRLVLVAVPIVILVLMGYLNIEDYMVTTVIIGTLFTVIDITLDFFVFGGIAVKEGTQLEYLKSSASGMKVMETALGVNMVRQFATLVVLFAGAAAIVWAKGGKIVVEPLWIACYVSMLLSSYVVINIVLVVMRHFDGFYLNVAASSFAMILMILFIFLFGVNVTKILRKNTSKS